MVDSDFKHSNNGKDQSLTEPTASFLKEYILVLQLPRVENGRGKENSWGGGKGGESRGEGRQKIPLI